MATFIPYCDNNAQSSQGADQSKIQKKEVTILKCESDGKVVGLNVRAKSFVEKVVGVVCTDIVKELNCDDKIEEDNDNLIDCADKDCVGKVGPNGYVCCQSSDSCDSNKMCDSNSVYGSNQCFECITGEKECKSKLICDNKITLSPNTNIFAGSCISSVEQISPIILPIKLGENCVADADCDKGLICGMDKKCVKSGETDCLPIGDVDTYDDVTVTPPIKGKGILNSDDVTTMKFILDVLEKKKSDNCGTSGKDTCDVYAALDYYICKNGVVYGEADHTCGALSCADVIGYGAVTLIGDVDTYDDDATTPPVKGKGVLNSDDVTTMKFILDVLEKKKSDNCGTSGKDTCDVYAALDYYICKNGVVYGEAGHIC